MGRKKGSKNKPKENFEKKKEEIEELVEELELEKPKDLEE